MRSQLDAAVDNLEDQVADLRRAAGLLAAAITKLANDTEAAQRALGLADQAMTLLKERP